MPMSNDELIALALKILESRAKYNVQSLSSPQEVKDYLRLKIGGEEREYFYAVWLDAQNRVIEFEQVSAGTLTQAQVYPREIIKSALKHNAAAVFLAHNHPSGYAEPSRADENITSQLKKTLSLIDVKLLDHFVISNHEVVSFAERGLL